MNRFRITIFSLLAFSFSSCNQKPPVPNLPTPVNTVVVQSQCVLYYDNYPATVQALSQVDLRPEVQGYITGIYFNEGSHVQKGQLLYEIDKRLYQAAYDQAVANLKVAQGNQDQAQQDADRYTYLNNQDAVAKQLYDHAIIALQNAKNSVKAAEEAVNSAKANFTYSQIEAPFNGTIGFSQVKLGNMVSVGQTVLNTVSTDDPMAVDFLVNEAQLSRFTEIQSKHLLTPDSLFTIILPDHSIYPYAGKIAVIDRSVDPQTGTIRIRLEFPNPKYILRAGMSCVVRVHNLDCTPQMVIPAKAVIEQMGEYFLFIVKDTLIEHKDSLHIENIADTIKGPRLHAFQKKVQLGQTIDDQVVIKAGISNGDQVVVDGIQTLHEGSRVSLAKTVSTRSSSMSDKNERTKPGPVSK